MSELPVRAIRARSVILRHWTAGISIGIRVDTSKFIENALTLCIAKYLVEFAPNVLNQKAHPTALTKEEIVKSSGALFPITLALGVVTVALGSAQAQDSRQEGPIEIEKCQTIGQPGSYKLVNNLILTLSGTTTAVCLQIATSFVTIDLAGFTISWPGPHGAPINPTTAIAAGNDTTGITVRNGSISGFGTGLDLEGSNSIVEGLHVGGPCPCERGIVATGIVRGNTVSGLAAPGGGVGITATGIVSGNYAFRNRYTGMEVGQGSTVIGNTVTDTFQGPGLFVDCPSNVTNNTAVNNGGGNLVLNGTGCNNTNNVAP
jgi:hypothetical protein